MVSTLFQNLSMSSIFKSFDPKTSQATFPVLFPARNVLPFKVKFQIAHLSIFSLFVSECDREILGSRVFFFFSFHNSSNPRRHEQRSHLSAKPCLDVTPLNSRIKSTAYLDLQQIGTKVFCFFAGLEWRYFFFKPARPTFVLSFFFFFTLKILRSI